MMKKLWKKKEQKFLSVVDGGESESEIVGNSFTMFTLAF
jgi:hypothetical protein